MAKKLYKKKRIKNGVVFPIKLRCLLRQVWEIGKVFSNSLSFYVYFRSKCFFQIRVEERLSVKRKGEQQKQARISYREHFWRALKQQDRAIGYVGE